MEKPSKLTVWLTSPLLLVAEGASARQQMLTILKDKVTTSGNGFGFMAVDAPQNGTKLMARQDPNSRRRTPSV